jgi:hypothetical protein
LTVAVRVALPVRLRHEFWRTFELFEGRRLPLRESTREAVSRTEAAAHARSQRAPSFPAFESDWDIPAFQRKSQ